jgi:hypothetical protein
MQVSGQTCFKQAQHSLPIHCTNSQHLDFKRSMACTELLGMVAGIKICTKMLRARIINTAFLLHVSANHIIILR